MPRITRRPTYGDAVRWIALNDSAGDEADAEEIALYISTLLVADLFGVNSLNVAEDIVRARNGEGRYKVSQ